MSVELIENGLRYKGLVRISEQVLVDRYNGCLQKFGLAPVATVPLHLDACGFSLEVASKLNDPSYLNPNGVGRRFIILTPTQADAPCVDSTFSTTRDMMAEFYNANMALLNRLTLRDAVYGYVRDMPPVVDDLDDILQIKAMRIEAKTLNGSIEKAGDLDALARSFRNDKSQWTDVAAMQIIVDLAKDVGDTRNGQGNFVEPEFTMPDHYSVSLFGGIEIVKDVVFVRYSELNGRNRAKRLTVDKGSGGQMLGHLHSMGMLEPLNIAWLKHGGLLDQRLRALTVELMPDALEDAQGMLAADFAEAIIQNNNLFLARDPRFEALSRLRKLVTFSTIEEIDAFERTMNAKTRLSLRRATVTNGSAWEINRALTSFALYDPLTLFILDKPTFYQEFATKTEQQKQFWLQTILQTYVPDKAAVEARLFR